MSSGKLSTELLAARDARQARLDRALRQALAGKLATTVFVSLAIPGADKAPPGADGLLAWAIGEALRRMASAALLETGDDAAGPWALLGIGEDAARVKALCIGVEESRPAARLVDLDVYQADGRQVGRAELGRAARPCLLCAEPAVDCIRLRRHASAQIVEKAHELVAAFAA